MRPERSLEAEKSAPNHSARQARPRWDADRRELWLGRRLVKRFRQPARNQVLVLHAFEEEGWPPAIDDPLPGTDQGDRDERLHNTVRRLNQNQGSGRIRFSRDGTGSKILWEVIGEPAR